MRLLAGLVAALAFVAHAEAQTIYCSNSFPGYRTCRTDDYRSTEWPQWQGQTIYQDQSDQPRDDSIVIDPNRDRDRR